MRNQSKIIAAALTLLAVGSQPSVVHAEDDNVFDGKSYPGAMCDSVISTVQSARVSGLYLNNSGSAAAVVCPVIQDSWLNTAGLTFGAMRIVNVAGQTFTCTQTGYDAAGNVLSTRSFTTTAGGSTQQLFFSGTYLPTTGNFGYIGIQCSVPASGQIRNYQVQERA